MGIFYSRLEIHIQISNTAKNVKNKNKLILKESALLTMS